MKASHLATGCVIAALAVGQPAPVMADMGDAIAGAIVGGIIGGAIAKDQQKRKAAASGSRSRKKSTVSSAEVSANREVQTALNHFGFPAGTPDGVMGAKSRAAVSSYQAVLGYPATGQLTEYERTILVTAYHRAMAGGPQVAQVMATHPLGMKGLLVVQRDEMAGVSAAGMAGAAAGAMAGATVGAVPALVPAPAPAAPAAPALPAFGGTMVSLGSHCNAVALKTSAAGGYATLATMADPAQALSEQFCLSRAAVIQQGDQMVRALGGLTPQQVAEQCKAFGQLLVEQVNAVSLRPAAEVLPQVSGFVAGAGQAPAQLAGTAKICLGSGYAAESLDVAMGSAVVLVAVGEAGYAELLGHHLAEGIGATRRPDLAQGWYEIALASGQPALVGPAPGRGDLIRKAVLMLNGRSEVPAPAPTLPVLAPPAAAAPVQEAAVPAVPAPEVPAPVGFSASQAVGLATALPKLMLGN